MRKKKIRDVTYFSRKVQPISGDLEVYTNLVIGNESELTAFLKSFKHLTETQELHLK